MRWYWSLTGRHRRNDADRQLDLRRRSDMGLWYFRRRSKIVVDFASILGGYCFSRLQRSGRRVRDRLVIA